MTLDELLKQLTSQGLHLIRVEFIPDEDGLSFLGTLTEYLEAAKALGSKTIFVSTSGITEDDFVYTSSYHKRAPNTGSAASWPFPTPHIEGMYGDGDDDKNEEQIDLCSVNPNLKPYKKWIGKDGRFDLLCTSGEYKLTFSIFEKWLEEFDSLRSEAETVLNEKSGAEQAQILAHRAEKYAETNAKIEVAIKKLHELISDGDFLLLRTQLAMLKYAINKIPELKTIDERLLKREIKELKAEIDARPTRKW